MKKIRLVHLYLGCFFAPLFVYFSVSGVWQTLVNRWPGIASMSPTLRLITTLHTSRSLKVGGTLSSVGMSILVLLMAVSLVGTIGLGVVMAFRFGQRKAAYLCLFLGVLVPTGLILLVNDQ